MGIRIGNRGATWAFSACVFGLSLSGCVPDEDTSPSAALFPAAPYGEAKLDFSKQLASHAAREAVEFHALLGPRYAEKEQAQLETIRAGLTQGYYVDSSSGNSIYRVQSMEQARQFLPGWDEKQWAGDSALAEKFRELPNASVAIIGQKEQRIFFFDQSNQLASVYPQPG